MPIVSLDDLTTEEVHALPRDRTCLVLSVSPIEAHGPHLTNDVDVVESQGVATALCRRLLEDKDLAEWTFAFHPPLPIGADCMIRPGTFEVRPSAIRHVVFDIGRSFARYGFRRMVISNHHGAPRHNLALDRAARALGRWTPLQAVSLSGNFMLDMFLRKGLHRFQEEQGLTDHRDALDLDLHGGTFETSEMLHLAPQKVRARYKDLPAMVKPLHHLGPSSGVLDGTGYVGTPGLATADLGQAFIQFIVDAVTPNVRDFLTGAAPPKHLALKDRALLWLIGHTAHVKDFFKARRAYAAVQTPSSTSTL